MIVYIFIVHIILLSIIAGKPYFVVLMVIIIIIGLYEISRALFTKSISAGLSRKLFSFSLYCVFSFVLIFFAVETDPGTAVFVYLTIAVFDGFSQVTGQLIGNTKLTPRLSPEKTIEGTIGGITAAILTSIILKSLCSFSIYKAIMTGCLLGVSGLVGDLTASYFKRVHNIKDFGNLLPGHGGVLDRFDSFFVGASAFWIITKYIY